MKPKDCFKEVCELVESGLTISESLDELGIESSDFYESINKKQKSILKQIKTASAAMRNVGGVNIKELHEFFTTQEYAY